MNSTFPTPLLNRAETVTEDLGDFASRVMAASRCRWTELVELQFKTTDSMENLSDGLPINLDAVLLQNCLSHHHRRISSMSAMCFINMGS